MNGVTAFELSQTVDAIARRVVELMATEAPVPAPQLVDAATLARMFGISRSAVYEHAVQFGAVKLPGEGRPMIRFDVEKARQAWIRCGESEGSQGSAEGRMATVSELPVRQPRRRRASAARSGDGLLPVKGSA